MAYLSDKKEICDLYEQAVEEGRQWRKDYPEYERLMDNGLLEDLDESLPEINDGSLAASLFKLPKRIINSKLTGRAKALDRDDAWLTEIANMQWENKIIPNANSQAPFHRKWKDAARKAAGYGGIPLITLLIERGDYVGADFIVAQAQDVHLEPGKVSDYDSDIVFWDIYLTDLQMDSMIERAEAEEKEAKKNKEDGYNKWNIPLLKRIKAAKIKQDRDNEKEHEGRQDKSVTKGGYHFFIAFQRGIEAPFYMYHKGTKDSVREWSNPDPSGDIPVHYLYCYQDFVNPYGIGIVQLAGGTQNVLDYMRQADVLATQIGIRPPIKVQGNAENADLDSLIYAQDQLWITGEAEVERQEISNFVYQALPDRVAMYKTSLNQLIPTGDTSISAQAGDPQYSKTPAGVKFQAANLSIDDEDFQDNVNMTFEAKARSMINTHFASMNGTELMKLSDEEREILEKAGIIFEPDENGELPNELEIVWDDARATFDFQMDAEQDKVKEDEKKLEGALKVLELRAADPMFDQKLLMSGKRLNDGELLTTVITLITDNDKILEDVDPEEQEAMAQEEQMLAEEQMMAEQEVAPEEAQMQADDAQIAENLQSVMQAYGVDEFTAGAMLEAERQGFSPEEIDEALMRKAEREALGA